LLSIQQQQAAIMMLRNSFWASGVLFALSASSWALESTAERTSYYFGLDLGSNLVQQIGLDRVDLDALILGLEDGLSGAEPQLSMEQIQTAVMALQQELQAQMEAESAAQRQAGVDFLAENALRDEVTVTDSGLQYEVLERSGSSVSPTAADTIRVHYHGTLIDGTVFDSSVDRGEPIEFPLDSVITGWIEGVQLMSEGDRFILYLPPELGYGDSAAGMIPPASVLIFEVELLAVL